LGVFVALCSSTLGTGCYTYNSLAGASPKTDERIRLTLTDAGAIAMSGYLGANVETVDGRLQARSEQGYEVAVASTELRGGALREWNGELATIPSVYVARAESRRLSVSKSALITGGIVGIAVAAARAFGGPTSSSASGRAPPGRS
jgi:hypothetical protein